MSYKPIVAVDFDGTLSLDSQYPNIGRFNTHLYEALMKLKGIGWSIVLWTCREGKELKENSVKYVQLQTQLLTFNH